MNNEHELFADRNLRETLQITPGQQHWRVKNLSLMKSLRCRYIWLRWRQIRSEDKSENEFIWPLTSLLFSSSQHWQMPYELSLLFTLQTLELPSLIPPQGDGSCPCRANNAASDSRAPGSLPWSTNVEPAVNYVYRVQDELPSCWPARAWKRRHEIIGIARSGDEMIEWLIG